MAKKKTTTVKQIIAERTPAVGSEQVVLLMRYYRGDTITSIAKGEVRAAWREEGLGYGDFYAAIKIIRKLTPEEEDSYYSQLRSDRFLSLSSDEPEPDPEEPMPPENRFQSYDSLGWEIYTCELNTHYNAWTARWPASQSAAQSSGFYDRLLERK